jgi:hypothetical protein
MFPVFLFILYTYKLSVNGTDETDRFAVSAVTDKVIKNINAGIFCNEVIISGKSNNVPFLISPISIGAIGAICHTQKLPSFKIMFIRRYPRQPSFQPSSQPSGQPTSNPTLVKPQLMTASVIGFLSIIVLIGFLRIYPAILNFFAMKKFNGYKYDILVMVDNDEAIVENINHEDVIFFRRTWIEEVHHTLDWMITSNIDILEKRFEVKFFDHYDLLYKGDMMDTNDRKGNDGDVDVYLHKAKLYTGMIIRVKPPSWMYAGDVLRSRSHETEIHDESDSSRTYRANLPYRESLTVRMRETLGALSEESENDTPPQQSLDVLDLPSKSVPMGVLRATSLYRRRSMGQKVHVDTHMPYGESLTMPMMPIRSLSESHIPQPQNSDVPEPSFARRVKRRHSDYERLKGNVVHVPELIFLPSFEDTRKIDPYEPEGQMIQLHPPSDPKGQMIRVHERSIEETENMLPLLSLSSSHSEESVCLESISPDVPGYLLNSFSANAKRPSTSKGSASNRQSIVNMWNLSSPSFSLDISDNEGQLHSTGTLMTISIIVDFYMNFYSSLWKARFLYFTHMHV